MTMVKTKTPRSSLPTEFDPDRDQADPDCILFGHPYDIIDAMMLFGAMLEPAKTGSNRIRLVIGRAMPHWPSLGWAIAICWHNRLILRMKGGEFGIREKLIFTTAAERWLEHALYRWYPDYLDTGARKATTPADIELTEGMLVCWLVNAMSRASARMQLIDDGSEPAPINRPTYLCSPRMTREVAERLLSQMGGLGELWEVRIKATDAKGRFKLLIPPHHYRRVEHWLSGCVHPQFWDRPELMN